MTAMLSRGTIGERDLALDVGDEIHALASRIYPICRSLTGPGVRETLDVLGRTIPLSRHSIRTGERVFDWVVPKEWIIRDAFIKDSTGKRVVDFADNNLHVVGYSMPIRRLIRLDELKRHIHTLPDQPDLVPYRTAYHDPSWGFCMAHSSLMALSADTYEVCIDADLRDGQLDYAEHVHAGATDREFLFTAHLCHPSLANDNCSGLALLAVLARSLAGRATRYTYRFLFAPATIGALTWLSRNHDRVGLVDHGLVVSCVGDAGGPTYKRSRRGTAFIDRAMAHLINAEGGHGVIKDFSPYGYDERQFCSPGLNMPVGLIQNSAFGSFDEYHTSADNLDLIRPAYLERTFRLISDVIEIVEREWVPINLSPNGEPQLGRRGLYPKTGGQRSVSEQTMAILWVLNLADGSNGLLDMAERSGMSFAAIADAADRLRESRLLVPASNASDTLSQ